MINKFIRNKASRVLVLVLALAMVFTSFTFVGASQKTSKTAKVKSSVGKKLNSADANSKTGITVKSEKNTINIHVNRVGGSGTARLYKCDAEKYGANDSTCGKGKKLTNYGTYLGEYTCGTTKDFTISRYENKGSDNLYCKYYLVQGSSILAGPVYATEIASLRNVEDFPYVTKKGLAMMDNTTLAQAKEMGCSNTVINFDMASFVYANEDENGNAIDNSNKNVVEFESNGETYYFDEKYIKEIDKSVASYSQEGMNVSLVVISWASEIKKSKTYPSKLLYLKDNRYTAAFNTSNELGKKYWIAAMEFLAKRYSQNAKKGLVNDFIIGNEVDYVYDWNLIQPLQNSNGVYQKADFNVYMEEYARTFRLANLAIKKYNANAKVNISLTHNWGMNCYDSYRVKGNNIRYNSYAPRQMLDWLNSKEKQRGDYDWGLATHPYSIGTTPSNPIKNDVAVKTAEPITGNYITTPWVTSANLEVYQLYLEQPGFMYDNKVRQVLLSESSICCKDKSSVSEAAYNQSMNEQAASNAAYYYRAAHLSCIKTISYFQIQDFSGPFGLIDKDGNKRPSYNVWKYCDTDKSFDYSNKYLKYIDSNANSYKDVMTAVKSDFNWNTHWDENKIKVRKISSGDVERTLNVDKTEVSTDDELNVTATGDEGDTVGLYKSTDNVDTVDPILYYPVRGEQNNIKYKSGATYNIFARGFISYSRYNDAKLPTGSYKIVLTYSGKQITKYVSITKGSKIGSTEDSLSINKEVYARGEDVVVTATGNRSNSWVGLYADSDTPKSQVSIFWYYINDSTAGYLSGKPTVLQTTTHNSGSSNASVKLSKGRYKLILFGDGGYSTVLKTIYFEVTGSTDEVKPLTALSYKMDDANDGFSNGVVTVTKDEKDEEATDCIMYWADASGNPLEGYTALEKFKLKGTTTQHDMTTHTIIPPGAKKLIAYATNGEVMSDSAVSVDLPDNCSYNIGEEPQQEFQIISDVHVTTDAGATGECKKSNVHFKQMLEDVKKNSAKSMGIFINGDIANTGSEEEFKKVRTMYTDSVNKNDGNLPAIHMGIGNHDWIKNNPNKQFQKYALLFNPDLKKMPNNVYYTENVNGYNFIYLGGEHAGLNADLSTEQIEWFDETMQKYTEEDPDKPVFVFLHQPFYNTVAGSLTGQNWDGVDNETALKKVMRKYGQIIMVNGHTHWDMYSESCMFPGDEDLPSSLNTAAVGYLWSSYNIITGEFAEGSHGYYVRVYKDKVVFLGRDFENNKFIPGATFIIEKNGLNIPETTINTDTKIKSVDLGVTTEGNTDVTYLCSNNKLANVTDDGVLIPKFGGDVKVYVTAYSTNKKVINRKTIDVHIQGHPDDYTTTAAPQEPTSKVTPAAKAPGKVKIAKVYKKKKKAKKLKIKLKRVAGAAGYQVKVYKTKKNAKKNKKAIANKFTSKIKVTIKSKKLKKKKKLFVRARAYGANHLYGVWSNIKKVKVK